mmetsp:Transcript_2007/g.7559  ORF Transcript_2007/g.7559 Transcript_2007/m.7559 type:complete len:418 (-) Transcript_2007:91-1344(-)
MASCAAISSCCLARTSAVDVPAIQPSLHPTRFLSFAALRARLARTSILASRTAWMGSSASRALKPDPNGSTSGSYASSSSSRTWILRGESDATGSSNASSSNASSSCLSSSCSILRRSLPTRNLSTSSSNGTVGPDRGRTPSLPACVVGLPVPLGFVNASGARVGRNPNRRARSVAFLVRLRASDFCVLVIGLLALAKGTSARGLCCVGGSPSRLADPQVSASWDKGVGLFGSAGDLAGSSFFGVDWRLVGTDSNVRSSDARVCCPPEVFIGEKRTGPSPPPLAAMFRPRTLGGDGDSSALGPSPPFALSTIRPRDCAGWIGERWGGFQGWTTSVAGSSRARSSSLALARFLLTNCWRRASICSSVSLYLVRSRLVESQPGRWSSNTTLDLVFLRYSGCDRILSPGLGTFIAPRAAV